MPHTLVELNLSYSVPKKVENLVSRRLELTRRTLSSLPDVLPWYSLGHNLLILKEYEEPMTINIYGAISRVSLCGFRAHNPLFMDIQLWSEQDGAKACVLFPKCEAASPTVRTEVMYPQRNWDKQTDTIKSRGECFSVYDSTNFDLHPVTGSAPPLAHPGCLEVGDVVQALCHLILRADYKSPPSYCLHLEQVNILAVRKDELLPGEA
ncbi:hypothetical protein VTO73DRAFT_4855 [Trametes versicolor]